MFETTLAPRIPCQRNKLKSLASSSSRKGPFIWDDIPKFLPTRVQVNSCRIERAILFFPRILKENAEERKEHAYADSIAQVANLVCFPPLAFSGSLGLPNLLLGVTGPERHLAGFNVSAPAML